MTAFQDVPPAPVTRPVAMETIEPTEIPGVVLPTAVPLLNKTSNNDPEPGLDDPFKLDPNTYAYEPRKIRVITIGAGFSGLLVAHKFQYQHAELKDIVEHKIFEALHDVGGTWLMNDYPGVQCDVPAHIYAFPFDPNPDWSNFYAAGRDIQAYIKATTKKWNLDRDIHFNHKVINAVWHEDAGHWQVTVLDTKNNAQRDEFCEILISSQGVLVHESWPSISGLRDSETLGPRRFKGHVTHSARWDHNFDYSGKRIAVIGNGSSGIQIVPQMAKLPGTTVRNFVRGPAWVYYRAPASQHLGRSTVETNPAYTDEEKANFQDPEFHRQERKKIIARSNKSFYIFKKGETNAAAMKLAAAQMAEKLGHRKDLCDILIPKWELGCRRITPGPGYLESFLKDNVSLTKSAITAVEESAVVTADGERWECDVVVCATGFDVSYRPRYPVLGLDKTTDLATLWADGAKAYMSICVPNYPNYFMMTGPNNLGGHGSLIMSLDWVAEYIIKWINKISVEDIKRVSPTQSALDSFIRHGDEVHKTLVWSGACSSWYKRGTVDGRVTALFGGSAQLFNRLTRELRPEDFEIAYRTANQWRFMGNGFTRFEFEEGADLAWRQIEEERTDTQGEKKLAGAEKAQVIASVTAAVDALD
ncbi:cyclohexanone 1,2-monooxygenase [Rhypophila decipiens]